RCMRFPVSTTNSTLGGAVFMNSSGSTCAAAGTADATRPKTMAERMMRARMVVVPEKASPTLANPSGGERHLLHREPLAGGLYRRFASAPVLLVLAALAGVAALEVRRVGAGDRQLDHLVRTVRSERFGPHRQHARSRIRARAGAVVQRIVV